MKTLDIVILDTLEQKKPSNVKDLVQLVQKRVNVPLDDIEKEIKNLQKKGLVSLEELTYPKEKFITFISPRVSRWFWIIMTISL